MEEAGRKVSLQGLGMASPHPHVSSMQTNVSDTPWVLGKGQGMLNRHRLFLFPKTGVFAWFEFQNNSNKASD